MPLPPSVNALLDRATAWEQALRTAITSLTELHWRLVAALVRQVVPDATGGRLHGDYTTDGIRLSLLAVLRDDESLPPMNPGPFDRLSRKLSESLRWIAENEHVAVMGYSDYDLPAPTPPEEPAMVAAIALPDGQLRIWEPDSADNDLGHLYVLDALGVDIKLWQRSDGLCVHVSGDADSRQVSPVLLVGVNDGEESEYSL